MENIGALAILLAFCFAIYAVVGSLAGKWARRPFLILSAERAVYCIWALLTTAAGILVYSLIVGDFRHARSNARRRDGVGLSGGLAQRAAQRRLPQRDALDRAPAEETVDALADDVGEVLDLDRGRPLDP